VVEHGPQRGEVALDLLELPLLFCKLEQRGSIASCHARHHGIVVARHVIALVREQMGKPRLRRVSRALGKACDRWRRYPLLAPRIPCAAGHINRRHVYGMPHGTKHAAAASSQLGPSFAIRFGYQERKCATERLAWP